MTPSVLIVDDSLTVRMDLKDAFEAAGFEAAVCGSLAEARAALARRGFDLLVTDVLLPDGDGVAFVAETRASPRGAGLRVVVLSSEAEVRSRLRGLASGADDYAGKPYDPAYLVDRGRELVRVAAAPSAPLILLVDDSAAVRAALSVDLRAAGYQVAEAGSGEEGLRLAAQLRPAAIVVDGALPGIDGATVIRRVRMDAALRRTPCVLLTGSQGPRDELVALDAGADAFVRKEGDPALLLARLAAILRRAPAELRGPASMLGPKRILAVDDSATYRNLLGDQLRGEGYDVVLASSGEEAVALLDVQSVDCILMDLVMPGLDGHETCRRIKADRRLRDTPLVMLTALDEREAVIRCIDAGADDYIAKAGDFDVLRARLRAQLRRRQFEDEHRTIRDQLARSELDAAEARGARELAETRAALLDDLRAKNADLEAANLELELARDQARLESQLKSRFLANASHELRTPLNAIIGFSDLLEQGVAGPLTERQQEYVGYVLQSGRHLFSLINEILDLSCIEAGRMDLHRQPLDLGTVVDSVRAVLLPAAERARVSLSFRVAADLPLIPADPLRVKQMLYNLVSNGVKFTPAGGRVELTATAEPQHVVVRVEDTGVGIAADDMHRLFNEFERIESPDGPRVEGTGLGLALTRRLVELHGGAVTAVSQLGKGSAFTLTLPR